MERARSWLAVGVGLVVLLAGCQRSVPNPDGAATSGEKGGRAMTFGQRSVPNPDAAATQDTGPPVTVDLNLGQYQITGPYIHENLAVFLFHTPVQDHRQFLTLDEGLQHGLVKVTEKENAQVNELLIENTSDLPLFLQEGDRLYGGRQDRIVYASLVVPPKSGQLRVPAFCVEPGRWSPGSSGDRFVATTNRALAPLTVRNAAKLAKNQQQVWKEVAEVRARFHEFVQSEASLAEAGRLERSSSLNEVLEAPAVVKLSKNYGASLESVVMDKPDAVGVAIAINGRFVEVNIYPNHQLLRRMYPRLIQSYVLDALAQKDRPPASDKPTPEDLRRFLNAGKASKVRNEQLNAQNRLEIVELSLNAEGSPGLARCASFFDGQAVHLQWVTVTGLNEGEASEHR